MNSDHLRCELFSLNSKEVKLFLAKIRSEMAVAAYAAIVSLIDVLEQIQDPSRHRLHLDRKQIEALQEKVSFLQEFLELHCSQRICKEIESLAWQISNVANEAEDIIDFHVVNQIRKGFPDCSVALTVFCKNIERIIENFDFIKGELMAVKEAVIIQKQQPRVSGTAVSTADPSIPSGTMVGFDEQMITIMEMLKATGPKSDLQILPIVGMGGIGKTTMARNVFGHPCMEHHFHVRLWVTISQEYSTSEILRGLLQDMGVPSDRKNNKNREDLADLGEKLYKSLSGKRYLVVMDDVWTTKFWDDLRIFFPDNKNGSRIMVTTRLSNLAVSLGSNNPFLIEFLDKDQSWDLFCKKAFPKDGCPPELEEVGKSVAKSCKGLPLAIVVVGGLLSKSNMTREYWEFVAKDVNSFANSGDDEHCLKILSLSYNQLPIHLKPCFLFMRKFSEDYKINVSELIRLWVADGLLKPIKDKTLEDVAQGYLKDLAERNLILIHNWTRSGRMKRCGIHDILRDLCIRESRKEHFYCVPKVQVIGEYSDNCFLCASGYAFTTIYLPQVTVASQPTSLAVRLLCDNCVNMYPQVHRLRLVKVVESDTRSPGEDILHPNKLRYLTMFGECNFVDNLIHVLWNLQTIFIHGCPVILPSEIWELPQLRHLKVDTGADLPNPPLVTQVDRKDSTIILKNLHTLSTITNFKWSEDAIERLPNLKTLEINYDAVSIKEWSNFSFHNLGLLHKLESLSLRAEVPDILKNITFPHLLKKLSLMYCNIPWEEVKIISSLPNLEVLKLCDAVRGPEWNSVEVEFLRLKILLIFHGDLMRWGAEKFNFPILEHLELRCMKYLQKIPSGIGEIETLRSIRLGFCSESVVNSAKEILEEQYSLGNEDLQLYVDNKLVLPGSG